MPRAAREVPWLDKIKGHYYVFFYDKEERRTNRISLRTEKPEEARDLYATFLATGKAVYDKIGSDLTVAKALDDYEREHVNSDKVVDKRRQRQAIVNLKKFFGQVSISSIDIPQCRAYADARRKGDVGGGLKLKTAAVGDSTIRRELVTLTAAANHAVRWKRLTVNERPSVELPAEATAEAPWYSKSDLAFLIATADPMLQRFLRILYWTGARRRAIENLTPKQINWAGGSINLLPQGKRQTKKRMPIVPVYDEIRDDLKALCEGKGPDEPLFPAADMYRPYARHCDDCGLGDKGHPHIMRHTRATHMLLDGVSIYDVAKLLGDTVRTVEKVYGHHSVEVLRNRTS